VSPVIKSLSYTDSDSDSDSDRRLSNDATAAGHAAGVYEVQYRPDIAGQYDVSVKYGGDQVPGSPFKVAVNPVGKAANVTVLSEYRSHTIRHDTTRHDTTQPC